MHHIIKYRWLIIAVSIAVTVGVAGFLSEISVESDLKSYFPSKMESMVATDRIEENFGNQDIIMILFEKKDIVNPASLKRVRQVDRHLNRVKGIRKTTSVFSANYIYGQDGAMIVEPAIQNIPEDKKGMEELEVRLMKNDLVKNIVVAEDLGSTAIIASLADNADEDTVFAGIQRVLEEFPGNETVHFGGLPYLRQQMNKDIKRDALILVPIALLLMIIFLYFVFREWRGVLLPFMVVLLSTVLALALIPMVGWKFYFISLLVPIMLIAIANDYGIHMIAKYQEVNASGNGMTMKEISVLIARKLWKPILITGITTIAGIAALLAHTMIPARQMAVVAGIGIVAALLYSIFLLPAVLSFMKPSHPVKNLEKKKQVKRNLLNRLSYYTIRNRRRIPVVTVVVTLVIGAGIFFLKVDSNEENFFPEKHPVKQASRLINAHYGGSENLSIMFRGDMLDPELLQRIDGYEQMLLEEPEIDLVMSFPDVIREISKALYEQSEEMYDRIPPSRNAVAQYMALYNMNGDPENLDQLVDFNYEYAHMIIRINSVGNKEVNRIIGKIRTITHDDPNVAAIGGYGFVRSQFANQVVRGQFYSLGIALLIVFVILASIFKSFQAGIVSIIPLGISIVVLFGIMGLTGVRLDAATALLSSVMIGVGVDYTIHFLWRYKEERQQHRPRKEALITTLTTTGRGILFNAFSVIIGFLVLIISSFTPIRFFGILIVISIFSCLIGALVVLPALVLSFRFKFLEPRELEEESQEEKKLLKAI
ncbi:MAG: efflux RND transporter permease subunit [Bacteroidales bacterium]|nr:efflux RND transporter permease subunit [Bacteroidales bacterium]MDT8432897.1 efflux RND transporter permease subunit [Bacteroidales bacterium]